MGPGHVAIRRRDALLPAIIALCGIIEFAAGGYGWLGAYLLAAGILVLRRRYPAWMPVAVAATAADRHGCLHPAAVLVPVHCRQPG